MSDPLPPPRKDEASSNTPHLKIKATLYYLIVVGFGLVILWQAFTKLEFQLWPTILFWTFLCAIAEVPIRISSTHYFSVASVIHFASIILWNAPITIICATVGNALIDIIRHTAWKKTLFNASQYAITIWLTALAFVLLKKSSGIISIKQDIQAIIISSLVYVIINVLLVVTIIALSEQKRFCDIWFSRIHYDIIDYLCLVSLGTLTALTYDNDPFAIILLAIPLFMAYVAFEHIIEREQREELIFRQQKLAAIGEMAAGLAHEIRNPLTAIRGFAQLLSDGSAKIDNYSRYIITETDRLNDLVTRFLQLARPKQHKQSNIDINKLIEHILLITKQQCLFKDITFNTILRPVPPVLGEADQIQQVYLNIITNAIQAMGESATKGILSIYSDYDKDRAQVVVRIRDSGPGMPPHVLKQLGTPFFTTREQGIGLGLSICYQIIQRHRGHISVSSILGEGTEFAIRVPISPNNNLSIG